MFRISSTARGQLVAILGITVGLGLSPQDATAAVVFSDGFEGGSLSKTAQNSAVWSAQASTAVSSDRAYSGSYSLKFTFQGGGSGSDSFAEQRIILPRKSDYWFKYKLYIPANYSHRSDGASNNKFLAVYRSPYEQPGFQVNFSLQPNGSGGSNVEIHYYNSGREGPVQRVATNFISDADKGKWVDIVAQVKVASSGTANDGIMKMWKNGQQVVNVTNLPAWGGSSTTNYIDQAYLLGWANSGFSQTTIFYIDDVQIADTPLVGGSTSTAVPEPPSDVTVQ